MESCFKGKLFVEIGQIDPRGQLTKARGNSGRKVPREARGQREAWDQ